MYCGHWSKSGERREGASEVSTPGANLQGHIEICALPQDMLHKPGLKLHIGRLHARAKGKRNADASIKERTAPAWMTLMSASYF